MGRKGRSREVQAKWMRGSTSTAVSITIGVASETDSVPTTFGEQKRKLLPTNLETDEARLMSTGSLVMVTQTNTALPIGKAKRRTLGIVTRTHTALPITSKKTLPIAEQFDTALTIIPFQAPPPTPPPGSPSIWRVELWPLNGTSKLINIPVQSWMFSYVLNAPGAFEADVQLNHALATEANFGVGQREIRVYRANSLVWGGYLWAVTASATDYKLRLRAEGYFSRLRRRIIAQDLIKYDRDQADIAWDLIQYTQSTHGTFGITDAHINTGVKIDHVYCATDKNFVGDSIDELAEMDDSFDFWITPTINDASNKVFKNASPRRGTTKAITINQDNALSADYEIDSADQANRIWGVGGGDCNPPDFEAFGSASIANYGELHDTITFDDLDHLPSVKAHTREELRLRKSPRRQVRVRLEERDYTWGTFDIGDIVTLASNRGYLNDSRQMRVLRIQINFDPQDRIGFYEMDLDSVIGA